MKYVEVWEDTVSIRDLVYSILLSLVLGFVFYLLCYRIISKVEGIDQNLLKGYSLIGGVIGCILAGIISSIIFKPKRIIEDSTTTSEDILSVIKDHNISLEQEKEFINQLDKETIEELKDAGLYDKIINLVDSERNE
jgi:hypothetical protein